MLTPPQALSRHLSFPLVHEVRPTSSWPQQRTISPQSSKFSTNISRSGQASPQLEREAGGSRPRTKALKLMDRQWRVMHDMIVNRERRRFGASRK